MRSIIVGASGLIGTALERSAQRAGLDIVGTCATRCRAGLRPFDLTRDRLLALVPDLGPEDAVLLLSAHIDQNWVLDHPEEARRVNVDGTIACMEEALSRDAHLVYMSTEAVFGQGDADGADETVTPMPLSLYARQKRESELHLIGLSGRWCIARTGSTVGWEDDLRCAVSATYRSLLKPGARMARDNLFTVTNVDDIAAGLLRIIQRAYCGIFHLAANPPVVRTELADWIMRLSRLGPQMAYEPVEFASIEFRERRPARAWLKSDKARAIGIEFDTPLSTVERKVARLDQMLGPRSE